VPEKGIKEDTYLKITRQPRKTIRGNTYLLFDTYVLLYQEVLPLIVLRGCRVIFR
jgi:hypothetical protein